MYATPTPKHGDLLNAKNKKEFFALSEYFLHIINSITIIISDHENKANVVNRLVYKNNSNDCR